MQLAGRGRNGQDGCERIVRGISLDCYLSVGIQWVRTRAVVKAFFSVLKAERHSSVKFQGTFLHVRFVSGMMILEYS